jgi:predicted hydrocarbon binding protein
MATKKRGGGARSALKTTKNGKRTAKKHATQRIKSHHPSTHVRKHLRHVKKTRKVGLPIPIDAPESYEEAIIKNIVNNSGSRNVPDEAVLFSSTLSNLSGNMKELHYKSGMQIGRALFRLNSQNKSYMFPEESIGDLVSFFEKAGHRQITYNSMPGHIELNMHEKGPTIGTNLHDFEAGIISGYLGAAEHRLVHVSEVECINNNGTKCRFVKTGHTETEKNDPTVAMGNFIDYIGRSASARHQKNTVSDSYYSLASSSLLDGSYLDSLRQIADYMGRNIGSRISNANRRTSSARVANVIRLLHVGEPTVISAKPFKMRVQFDSLSSRKGYVELSMAFINGLLSKQIGDGAFAAVEHTNKGAYVVDIREKN